ncbi:hypothetical protein O6H91_07G080200 [Diphasiastrum complanatum]|uniref:Uncharacterized protein n=2 Tax=Diphasiastrum complanatum TaxID=34168 RepID=A0ACC2D597_DIPCM|nr:hypothetical protein O6H91_07G042600 [Diphasiastrum complanatum]KAJ7550044.1 hypothetical protein O6H91_07G080200 [Diphasiastrum complanatum]
MAMPMAVSKISLYTQEPEIPLVAAQKRLSTTKKRGRPRRSSKSNSKSTDFQQDPRATDYSHEGSHCGVLNTGTEASHPGKEDIESSMYWQEILQSPTHDGDLSNADNYKLAIYDNTKWALPEPWALEANHDQGGKTVLLSETELIELTDQKQEQSDLPTWILEANIEGKPSCSTKPGFTTVPNASTISSTQEASIPARKRKNAASNVKKEIHILTERERRKCMNDLFAIVRSLLPEPSAKKDKATLLSDFIEHIRAHQQKIEGLKQKRADLAAVKSSSQICESSKKKADTDAASNSKDSCITLPSQTRVVPYVRIHRSGQDAYVTVTCIRDPRISFSILKVMIEHHLQLLNVHISSDQIMLFHNLQCKVKNGSNFCKDGLHSRLQQLIDI